MRLSAPQIIIIIAVIVLLFGARKLPDLARSLGRSMRILKTETKGLIEEPEPEDLDEKADAQASRQPLAKGTSDKKASGEAQVGEVVDPPERVRDNG